MIYETIYLLIIYLISYDKVPNSDEKLIISLRSNDSFEYVYDPTTTTAAASATNTTEGSYVLQTTGTNGRNRVCPTQYNRMEAFTHDPATKF